MKEVASTYKLNFIVLLILAAVQISCSNDKKPEYSSDYFKIRLDERGWITSMKNITVTPHPEFSPVEKPSPLMRLYDEGSNVYYEPVEARYNQRKGLVELSYANGSVATIGIQEKDKYIKLTLKSLSPRDNIDGIEWGTYHTSITNLVGEIIGVARDTSAFVNYAIGMLSLDDNTTGGPSTTIADAAPFQYIIHSPDTVQYPLPDHLREGQIFSLGGDGVSDVAFYAHKEPYYRIMYGNTAMVDDKGQISLSYHSRDRTKEREVYFSLIPNMVANTPNHLQVQAVPEVDYIGSSVALWGSPDDRALMDVIQAIVLEEGLPYPTIAGKWVKDPTAYVPDALAQGGQYDSLVSYTKKLGFRAISLYDQGFLRPDRGTEGYLDGKDFEKKPIKMASGNKSHREFSELAAEHDIVIGRTNITVALAPGTKDASPVPSDSLWYQQKRLLANDLTPDDTLIYVDDPSHLEETGSWEGHSKSLNMVKIGGELIHYLGVSETTPYRLLNVRRGYWGTLQSAHSKKDTIYKLQVTINFGYDGLIPNLQLQDEIAKLYADICAINGLSYYDFDGQEFLFNNGHGYYSTKRFFRKMFEQAEERGVPDIRFTGATLSEGSWHYQSIWNVGGGTNVYDVKTREWGSTTSQGKDMRDVNYANFFPVTMGANFKIQADSEAEDYEHVQAVAVGIGATYSLILNQKDVESCPEKDAIFEVIRTWENARAANAFSKEVRKLLVDPARSWRLKEVDGDTWRLYESVDGELANERVLRREKGY